MLRRLKLSGLLSFGPKGVDLPMAPLNVLIGANGSGKSNLLEAIALLRSAPRDLAEPIACRGGPTEFFWKGPDPAQTLHMEAIVDFPPARELRHVLSVTASGGPIAVSDERIEVVAGERRTELTLDSAKPKAEVRDAPARRPMQRESLKSVSNLFLAAPHTELWYLKQQYEAIRLYRNWSFGPDAPIRAPCGAHGRSEFLDEDGGNLALVLSQFFGDHKQAVLDALRSLYEGIVDFHCPVIGGTVRLVLVEKGNRDIPATLLSDGALRYLCLLAVLLHPQPPPLICIEEPELGLHPDLMPTVSDLMCDASERSQLVVTTHSDVIVDTLTEQPESVVICEKYDGETEMHRLDRAGLANRLKDYGLGDLWTDGELGGNRW